nr:GIY-YIG nuclease family protein [Clostridium minihomine]
MKAENTTQYYAYMLRCADGTIYSGYTTDPNRRTALHNKGKGAKYTRSRLPVELVFVERCATKREALQREAALKRLSRGEKLSLIEQGNGSF